jgi:uncharacterized protein (TIGR00251 family)
MIALGDHPDGTILPVAAQPRARRTSVLGEHDAALKVAVTAAPEDGKANAAIVAALAEALDCKAFQITLLSGASSRRKRFLIKEMTRQELAVRLESLLSKTAPKAQVPRPKSSIPTHE